LKAPPPELQQFETDDYIATDLVFTQENVEDVRPVIFEPNPGPQEDFLAASEQEVLYGGAAGGGKSYAVLADAIRDMQHPQFRGLIVRRSLDELRELIQKSQELYPKIFGKNITWSESRKEWSYLGGGRLWFSYLEKDQDVLRYVGQAFSYIAFDELTQWPTPYCYNFMRSRLRTTSPDLKTYIRATTNPGGPGMAWVKKMFVDPAPWGKSFWATDIDTGETMVYPESVFNAITKKYEPHPKAGLPLFKRKFIPARLYDNPYLTMTDGYEANLLSLPEIERKRLLEGDWDAYDGAAFTEWNRALHVVEPFDIPTNWRKFRSCDYGYGSYAAVLWFAIDPDDRLYVYRELYVSKMLAVDLADEVRWLERDDGRISYGVLDSSCWAKRGDPGPSIAEQMIARKVNWRPSDRSKGSRVAGKQEVHRRLKVDENTEEPGLMIFSNCTHLIAQLPLLPLDKNNPEDIDTNSEDHLYDALRYGLMTRPRSEAFGNGFTFNKQFIPADRTFGY
jgi:hypothetical protein